MSSTADRKRRGGLAGCDRRRRIARSNQPPLTRSAVVRCGTTPAATCSRGSRRTPSAATWSGGGFVGIHGAGGDPRYEWRWYVATLLGAQFTGHPLAPQFQTATICVEPTGDLATAHLSGEWIRTDEWYSFESSPRATGARVLATLDERTYRPRCSGWISAWAPIIRSSGSAASDAAARSTPRWATPRARIRTPRT